MTRIFIVEDHPIVRRVVRAILEAEADFAICGEAESGEDALGQLASAAPDVMLIDLSLPGMSGLDLLRESLERRPGLECVVVSGHRDRTYVARAMRLGAHGYVLKDVGSKEIPAAVRAVWGGGTFVSPMLREVE